MPFPSPQTLAIPAAVRARPAGVIVLSMLCIGAATAMALQAGVHSAVEWWRAILWFGASAAVVVLGCGLWMLRGWARMFARALCAVNAMIALAVLIGIPILTALGKSGVPDTGFWVGAAFVGGVHLYFLLYLTDGRVGGAFTKRS